MNSELIETHWSLDNVIIDAVLQKSGERVVTKIGSNQGAFVFKQASSSKDETAMLKDTAIFEYLSENDFNAPKLLKTKNGKNFQKIGEQFVYALRYIDGNTPDKSPLNYAKLGALTARLHNLKGYQFETDFDANTVINEKIEEYHRHEIGPEYLELLRGLPDFSVFPKSIIHTDIGINNSLQMDNGDMVLIDWDDAGVGTRILDTGFPLICGFVNEDIIFEMENARAFYTAYFECIELTPDEKAHIFDAALFYILMYSIFDGAGGVHEGNWAKAQFAAANKERIISSLL